MSRVRFIIICLLFIPFSVSANEMSISCPSKINSSSDVICSVKANFTINSDQVAFMYQNDNVLFDNFSPSDGWSITEGGTSNSKGVVLTRENEVSGISDLGSITYKSTGLTENFSIKIYGFDATNGNADRIDFSNNESIANIHVNHSNNYLKSIVINGNDIGFNKDKVSYSYSSVSDTVTISAVLDDNTAYCENLNRTVKLNDGNNIVEYNVKAENGVVRTYRISILYNKINNNSNNNADNNSNNNTNNNSNNVVRPNDVIEDNTIVDDDVPDIQDDLDVDKNNDLTDKKNDKIKESNSNNDLNDSSNEDSESGKKFNYILLGIGFVVVIVSVILIIKNKDQLYKND